MSVRPLDFYRRRRIDANIDMTPMIDTLFQLFMLFLLSASFVSSTVELQLPQADAAAPTKATPVVVSMDAEHRVYVDGDLTSADALVGLLQQKLEGATERSVALRADRSVAYQDILDTIVNIQKAGVSALELESEPRSAPPQPETQAQAAPPTRAAEQHP